MKTLLEPRQERIYLIIAGFFLGTLGVINILGLSRFVDLSFSLGGWTFPLVIPLGVLPYPLTFLCTDLISELFGRERANRVVWIGFGLNAWLFFLVWLGGILPSAGPDYAFYTIRTLTMSSIIGSMIAYLVAQLLDVHLFHFCKDLTKNKHLWLRNNVSTLISQAIDTFLVISIAYLVAKDAFPLPDPNAPYHSLGQLMLSSYSFKALAALADTLPFYLGVYACRTYFRRQENGLMTSA
jgi:uncharacterized integral membrane protein (TIGR00697 family)